MKQATQQIGLGAIVTMTGAVVGTSRHPDGRTSYLVRYDRKGEIVEDWFFAEEFADLGFDDDDCAAPALRAVEAAA
ncbi:MULTISPECIES: hypothetical protein [unclassified Mesorhizobium]|uniref:hypothetical protein n=1 Tax=unclassified Mesorhizobium TaxID=325217 RepID=UPI000FCBD3C9|nr:MULTISPECIES: hypothetical protein [unclassified Mesorhizobium]RVD68335.1 hypothetical protein EN751_31950 [Mesorhizobium sp. M4A.F.Ca.ET.029.04.2.1]RUW68597.1 hypothetical protein EOA31_25475 [Mesorhizobium sp. M4B.F.Ca.ET.049.02.1.2]TGV26425.1 hypothetical protein EN786_12990 [Mesorhizobium sp. M4B.F.Ca.ET.143.01.1.1]TIW24178.1 MAG: hypothetical protein E5V63_22695 [Mesorhizobium sp.]TIW34907.1 MAG: hypothetical protein E5V62_13825 [Mesorhizobium sp.]